MKYNTMVSINAKDFCLVNSRDELLTFIKELDQEIGDWDFTLEIADHFAALRLEYEQESKEIGDL